MDKLLKSILSILSNTVECLIFARALLREFREAPKIRQI